MQSFSKARLNKPKLSKQCGMGTIEWMLIILIGGFFLRAAYITVPAYLNDVYISDALKSLAANNRDVHDLDKGEIRDQLEKYLSINAVSGESANGFKILKKRDKTLVNNRYEVRTPFAFNIDLVMRFEHQLDSSKPTVCCKYLVPDEK